MLFADSYRWMDARRHHPQQELHAPRVSRIGKRPHAVGEQRRVRSLLRLVGFPAPAHIRPSGIDPVALHRQVVIAPEVDLLDVLAGIHPGAPVAVGDQAGKRLPARSRRMVAEQEPPPKVVRPQAIALPEKCHDARTANLLTGMQHQMHPLHPGAHLQRSVGRTFKAGRPRPRPTQAEKHSMSAQLDIEERHGLDRRRPAAAASPTVRPNGETLVLPQSARKRCEVGVRRIAPLGILDRDRLTGRRDQANVQRLQILDDRGVMLASVHDVDNPLHCRVVLVLGGLTPNLEGARWIGPRHRPCSPMLIQHSDRLHPLPGLEPFR